MIPYRPREMKLFCNDQKSSVWLFATSLGWENTTGEAGTFADRNKKKKKKKDKEKKKKRGRDSLTY
jgi:hypothetical protein